MIRQNSYALGTSIYRSLEIIYRNDNASHTRQDPGVVAVNDTLPIPPRLAAVTASDKILGGSVKCIVWWGCEVCERCIVWSSDCDSAVVYRIRAGGEVDSADCATTMVWCHVWTAQ